VNFLPLARLHLLIGFRGSGSLMTMISAENAEFSQDNRNSACKRAHQRIGSFHLRISKQIYPILISRKVSLS
jgi:hypothetical protein